MSTILRNKIADYLGKGTEIMFMGAGFNSLNEEPNAQTSSKTYINEVNSTTRITNYQPVFPYDSDFMKDEKAIYELYLTGRNRKTGTDAEFDYYRVDLFEQVRGTSHYPARKMRVSNEVSSFEGEGGAEITVSGNLNQIGNHVDGVFNVATKNFIEEFKVAIAISGTSFTATPNIGAPTGHSFKYKADTKAIPIPASGEAATNFNETLTIGNAIPKGGNTHITVVLVDSSSKVVAFGEAKIE